MSENLHLEVSTIAGNLLHINLDDKSTALDVKHVIEAKWDIPETLQQLVLGSIIGVMLQDADTLSSSSTHDDHLSLTVTISFDPACRLISEGNIPTKLRVLEDISKLSEKGGASSLHVVVSALHDKHPSVIRKAKGVLGSLAFAMRDDAPNMEVICGLLNDSKNVSAGVEALAAAQTLGNPVVITALCRLIERCGDKHLLLDAVRTLTSSAEQGNPAAIETLCGCLNNPDEDIRLCAVKYLADVTGKGDREVLFAMVQCLQDPDDDVGRAAVVTLRSIVGHGDAETIALLSDCIKNSQGSQACAAMQALAYISERGEANAVSLIIQYLEDARADVRYSALRSLAVVASKSDSTSIRAISRRLHDPDDDVRYAAVKALSRIAEKNNVIAIASLNTSLNDANDWVRGAAKDALAGLLDQEKGERVVADQLRNGCQSAGIWEQAQSHLTAFQLWWPDVQDMFKSFPRCSVV